MLYLQNILINQTDQSHGPFVPLDEWQRLPSPDVSIYEQVGGGL